MQVTILLFGQLTDLTGTSIMTIDDAHDTNSLINKLNELFPKIAETKYSIAVDKQIISANTPLSTNATVALLPPFSGG